MAKITPALAGTEAHASEGFEMNNKLHRLPAVIEITGLGRSTIYRMMDEGTFPKPIKLGQRAVAWQDDLIRQWIASRPVAA